jgi:hypothetical protein
MVELLWSDGTLMTSETTVVKSCRIAHVKWLTLDAAAQNYYRPASLRSCDSASTTWGTLRVAKYECPVG